MAVRPSDDPLDCFSSLADIVPQWLTRVSDLAHHTAARHAEFSAEYVKLTAQGNSKVLPQRRRKTSSLNTSPAEEQASKTDGAAADAEVNGNPNPDNTSSSHLASDDPFRDPLTLLRLSRTQPQDLKRKHPDTSPSRSKPGSKPHTRVRHAVIVHYDSHTQQTLETLVRDFGGARNKMRKGRMQHMMKTGFGFKSGFATGRTAPGRDDGGFDEMRPMFRSSRLDPSKNMNRTKEVSPFDMVDKHLESAQALCEVSAHQFLRHGDCSTELEKTKERLELVLATARSEAERLRLEAEAEAEKEKARTQQSRTEDQRRSKPDRRSAKVDQIPLHGLDDHIEVDDSSDSSSVSIDIKAFRRSRQR